MKQAQKTIGQNGTSKKNWEAILAQWKASGLNQSQFCKANNIKPSSLPYWIHKIKNQCESGQEEVSTNFALLDKVHLPVQNLQVGSGSEAGTADLVLIVDGFELKFNDKLGPEKLRAYLMVLRSK